MGEFMDAMRAAVAASGKSRYRIAQDTGIAESILSRLMSGETSLAADNAEKLADYLGLEIVLRPKRARSRKGK
jgi:transcriptional regulator with XRE-family HTH domain